MQNTKNKTSHTDVIPATNNEFAVNLLKKLQDIEPKRLLEVRAFFSDAFLLMADHDALEEKAYRLEWATNIYVMNEMCKPFEKYSSPELEGIISNTLENLKKEKEVDNV